MSETGVQPEMRLEILQQAWHLFQESRAPDSGKWALEIFRTAAQAGDAASAQSAIAYVGKVVRCKDSGWKPQEDALELLKQCVEDCTAADLRHAAIYELGLVMAAEAPVISATAGSGEALTLTTQRPHGFCKGDSVTLNRVRLRPSLPPAHTFVVISCDEDRSLTLHIELGSHASVSDGPASVIRADPNLARMNKVHDFLMQRWEWLGRQHLPDEAEREALRAAWQGALGEDIRLQKFCEKVREALRKAAPAGIVEAINAADAIWQAVDDGVELSMDNATADWWGTAALTLGAAASEWWGAAALMLGALGFSRAAADQPPQSDEVLSL